MRLAIGDKTYSSWSLRAWLAARASGVDFEEELLPLDTDAFHQRIREISPAGRVPVLVDGDVTVWDSLAIIEYLAEVRPGAGLWPEERAARARARAVVAEFHAGFFDLRGNYPMNLRRAPAPHPRAPDASRDIARITEIWRDCRERYGSSGNFLFGRFGAADCFFAPVASRFLTYELPLGEVEQAYAQAVMEHPFMLEWRADAAREIHRVEADEVE